ncbi:Presilphiperfolan-8-beta-ol synthase [Annulohypoxylon maeteangense]|uniref:Presilphiperfolan-8-beta-ol synthase n=1 Tax=Annulohypoxylon maeteangense TaxID=1927788 RepID=UPI002008C4A6|nr:Presilphiperfolan-8-beta-ol synthase [Annulohypoxylon maeteangense]KAI0887012.1 Presilphiperfolan-8-beta-ol synthase [Annulohypoxylon maeteangense]
MAPSIIENSPEASPVEQEYCTLAQFKPKSAPKPVMQPKERRSVRIPDLFSSIMSPRPVVNPHYFKVKVDGERWIAKLMKWDQKMIAMNTRVDFCYLASLWAPTADEAALRVVLDWAHWVFLFDDQFDEGHLKDDPAAAQDEVNQTMAIMEEGAALISPEENPIRHVFQTCWLRVKENSTPEFQQRYKNQHRGFFDQLVVQVQKESIGESLSMDVQTFLEVRRGTVGASPAIALAEYGAGVNLPEHVYSHPALQEIVHISVDLVLLVNDVLSFRKDLNLGVDHNLIAALMSQDRTLQQAVDEIGSMLDNCYRRWYTALAQTPVYGEEIDLAVLKFAEACRCTAVGNLHWGFKTGRYLGSDGGDVKETRILYLPG